jgi:hypothetical protein
VRVSGHAITVVLCLALVGLRAQKPDPAKADQTLSSAREALGGAKLAAVKNFVATGRTRRLSGNNLVPIEFEISVELPDKYVRKDEIPAQENEPTSTGFNGTGLIQIPQPAAPGPPPARAGATPPTPEALEAQRQAALKARVTTAKQDFARLMLGLFASSFSGAPLTFAYAGEAEAPQGTADVIDAKGEGTFALRLLVASDTHLPVMVSWQQPPSSVLLKVAGQPAPATVPPGAVVVDAPAPPAASAAQDEKDKYTKAVADLRRKAMAQMIESRLYFADYRDADGVKWPFRLRRAVGADTTEETTFDRFRVNTKIDPKKFEVVK